MKRCPACGYEEMPGELRSNEQNRRYWKVVVERITRHLERRKGNDISKHSVHDGLKGGYLGFEENPLGGPPIPCSTTKLSKAEFAQFMDRIEADFSAPPHCVDFSEGE